MVIVHQGGPVRAFDRRMPAFGEVLSDERDRTDDRLRPRLLRRPRVAARRAEPAARARHREGVSRERGRPDDERSRGGDASVVRATCCSTSGVSAPAASSRSSCRSRLRTGAAGEWQRGLGDVAVAVKHVLFHSARSGTILSAGGEVVLPTGKETRGLGKGVTIFEPFVAVGQMLPRRRVPSGARRRSSCRRTAIAPATRRSGVSRSARASRSAGSGARGRRWSSSLARGSSTATKASSGISCRRCRSRSAGVSTS